MEANTSKITIHMVSSLDGFIAKKDGDISWLHSTDNYADGIELTEEAISAFLEKIDCYVMGSKTYEHAMELGWPYGNTSVVVLTHRNLSRDKKSVEFYSGDLVQLTNQLKSMYKNIWMVGGAALTKNFINSSLADEIVVSIVPVIVGGGTLFFDYIGQEHKLHLKDSVAYKDGMVELTYEIVKE